MTKAERLEYGESLMTHAMVLTGVNLVKTKPTKWKVENSWGSDTGDKGFYLADDAWFDEFVYQVVINKKYLSQEQLEAYESDPIELEPWDPMGSLA
jgi:bleomycin hydrolase